MDEWFFGFMCLLLLFGMSYYFEKLQKNNKIRELENAEKKEYQIKLEKNKELEKQREIEYQKKLLKESPLTYFGAVEGGETTFYYLKLKNKSGETRYKIGVTLNTVAKRYQRFNKDIDYEILLQKKFTHANKIEKKILKEFHSLKTYESLLGTSGTEIFKEDILKLDFTTKNKYLKENYEEMKNKVSQSFTEKQRSEQLLIEKEDKFKDIEVNKKLDIELKEKYSKIKL